MSALVQHPDGKVAVDGPDPSGLTCLWKPVDPNVLIGAIHGELLKRQ